jgi:hypothetical protein
MTESIPVTRLFTREYFGGLKYNGFAGKLVHPFLQEILT